ncbi:MAG TPA: hypothetical protein VM925_15715 [Labilithrix sp.]|nr:hypothetical protein [Labilithrix sp.]
MKRRTIASVLALASATGLPLAAGGCKSTTPESKPSSLANAAETWCPVAFEPGPLDTCFGIPDQTTKDTPVLVYLHGMYRGHGSPEEWAALGIARQRGFAVVVPRGKRGLCAWRAELKDHYCWPQDPEDTQAIESVVAEWDRVLWQVDALLESGTHKRFVLGSSNGGVFASFLATSSVFPGEAYAIVNGGPMGAPPDKARTATPVLLVAGQDAAEAMASTKELHEALTKAAWPHGFCPRGGGASLTNEDVEAAVRFFKQAADGSLKPQNGAYTCDGSSARR